MTSSESPEFVGPPVPPDLESAAPPPVEPTVVAAGHLHPGVLFLRLLDGLRNAILPLAVALVAQQSWLMWFVLVMFVYGMAYWLARYMTFRYVLTEDELITTEGILHRQERRIPVDRIQDLNFESSLLRRMTGLVVVSVETASGKGAEASLDSLGRYEAEQLREVLLALRRRSGQVQVDAPPPEEIPIFSTSAIELTVLGLTNNRVGAIIVGLFAIFEFADELGFGGVVFGTGSDLVQRLGTLSPPVLVVILAAGLFLFLLAGWLLSIAASFVMFHDFRLTQRDDVILRRFGLITTRSQSLPKRRIQRVLLEASLLRRLLGMVVVRADSAGSGMDAKEELRSGRDIIAPVTQRPVGEAIVPWLLPDLYVQDLDFQRVSPKVVGRIFAEGLLLTTLVVTFGWLAIGPIALVALILVPIAWMFGFLAYHNLGYRELEDYFALRWGILGRYRAFVPLHKVQAAQLDAGPVDRLFGLASLVVYVAGGSPTRLSYLPRREAERLKSAIAARAAESRFVW